MITKKLANFLTEVQKTGQPPEADINTWPEYVAAFDNKFFNIVYPPRLTADNPIEVIKTVRFLFPIGGVLESSFYALELSQRGKIALETFRTAESRLDIERRFLGMVEWNQSDHGGYLKNFDYSESILINRMLEEQFIQVSIEGFILTEKGRERLKNEITD